MPPIIICIISFIIYILMSLLGNYIEKKCDELPYTLNSLPELYASIFYHLVNIAVGIICIVNFIKWIISLI